MVGKKLHSPHFLHNILHCYKLGYITSTIWMHIQFTSPYLTVTLHSHRIPAFHFNQGSLTRSGMALVASCQCAKQTAFYSPGNWEMESIALICSLRAPPAWQTVWVTSPKSGSYKVLTDLFLILKLSMRTWSNGVSKFTTNSYFIFFYYGTLVLPETGKHYHVSSFFSSVSPWKLPEVCFY